MKTMTCRMMGGPCDAPFHGNTVDEIMKMGSAHLKEMAGKGDEGHKKAMMMMEDMMKDPNSAQSQEWNRKFAADFAALPEE